METGKTYHRKKIVIFFVAAAMVLIFLIGRLSYLMIFCSEHYLEKARILHERERAIKALRGEIYDRNGEILATNITVCTISVIYSQVTEPEKVSEMLAQELELSYEDVLKKVTKKSSIEKIKSNVTKEVGDRIREYDYAGVKVDEDYKRYYPYNSLCSKVLGFTGSDNQGIVGLEVYYDEYLTGESGNILTITDARGVEIEGEKENRQEPVAGLNLQTSIDYNIQSYCEQAALKVMEEKNANSVVIIVMNPVNGEIYAMVNVPEYNLNEPFTLNYEPEGSTENKQDLLNQMWRCKAINDTYEPGSTFKMITAASALEENVVSLADNFSCGGFAVVEDRRIRCHKTTGHGAQTFTQTVMNSCNPAFIEWGQRLGIDNFYKYFDLFGLTEKTGIDLPGEATGIMHKKENVGLVELATISFGQSFQITPIQLLSAASSIINGGNSITPHFGMAAYNDEGALVSEFTYEQGESVISSETSEIMKDILFQVVEEGGGKNAKIEGYQIGGKTATSQKLPRSAAKYIASFIGFAPVDDPKVIAMCIIDEPEGVYYGGTIAAPVIRGVFDNILPYLGIEKSTENLELN